MLISISGLLSEGFSIVIRSSEGFETGVAVEAGVLILGCYIRGELDIEYLL